MEVNEYFLGRPHNVLGTLVPDRKRGAKYRPEVRAKRQDTAARLQDALGREIAAAVEDDLVMIANPERRRLEELLGPDARTRFGEEAERFDGRSVPLGDGSFWTARLEDSESHPCLKAQRTALRALLDIRDAVSDLLDAEMSPNTDEGNTLPIRRSAVTTWLFARSGTQSCALSATTTDALRERIVPGRAATSTSPASRSTEK
ncbi:hypothetical protein [Streptomyces flaveolus]|uniref:hypothetical protein n=1 Tax=Streptomyces flaveolus TaxID=67297 RepID=UPI0036FF7995